MTATRTAGSRRRPGFWNQSLALVRNLLLTIRMHDRPVGWMVLVALAVALWPTGIPAAAPADSERSTFEERPTALYLQLGLGTPTGALGVEAERVISPFSAVAAGGGLGASGPQAAAMVRLRRGDLRSAVVAGAGVSGGHYRWFRLCMDTANTCPKKEGNVVWANFELGGAYRSRAGFALRYFVGYGRMVAGNYDCVGDTRDYCLMHYRDDGKNLLYLGFAVGYAF
jgi:hypothetical protein